MVRCVSVEGIGSWADVESGEPSGSASAVFGSIPAIFGNEGASSCERRSGDGLDLTDLPSSREVRVLLSLVRLTPLNDGGLAARGAKLVTDDIRAGGARLVGDVAMPDVRWAAAGPPTEGRAVLLPEGRAGGAMDGRELILGRGRGVTDEVLELVLERLVGVEMPDILVGDFTGDCPARSSASILVPPFTRPALTRDKLALRSTLGLGALMLCRLAA